MSATTTAAAASASTARLRPVGARGRVRVPSRPVAEQVGAQIEQLAALLSAGVAPDRAVLHLAESAPSTFLADLSARIAAGATVTDALSHQLRRMAPTDGGDGARSAARGGGGVQPAERRAWEVFGAAWFAAVESGAPLAECLAGIAECLRGLGAVEREIRVALAGPVATSRLVFVLPLASFAGGTLLGLDPLGTVVSNPAASACAALALLLLLVAALWSRRLLARARRVDPAPGLLLDLVAVALTGGGSVPRARAIAADALARAGLPVGATGTAPASASAGADAVVLDAVLGLAQRSGAPPGELLRREAARLRRDTIGAAAERAAALGVWLLLPLGLCVLPAFVLLTVAPVLIGVITSTTL